MAAGGTLPTLDRIVRVGVGAATMWELTTGETMVRVTQAELHTQARFRMAWHARNGGNCPRKAIRVARCFNGLVVSCRGGICAQLGQHVIWAALEDFCTDSQAMEMEELLNGLPWTDKD